MGAFHEPNSAGRASGGGGLVDFSVTFAALMNGMPATAATVATTGYAVGSSGSETQVGVTETFLGITAVKFFHSSWQLRSHLWHWFELPGRNDMRGFGRRRRRTEDVFAIRVRSDSCCHRQDPQHYPWGHLEKIRVQGGITDTGWIDHIANPRIIGNSGLQLLSMQLTELPEDDRFYVKLKFKAKSFFGANTPEYLIATLSATAVPAALFGSALAGLGGLSRWR